MSFSQDMEDDDPEMTIYCVTCGHQINQKTAVKHMEKCYAKVRCSLSLIFHPCQEKQIN